MKSKAIVTCAFATAILTTTMSVAHSTESRGRLHYAHRHAFARGTVHHRDGGHLLARRTRHHETPVADRSPIETFLSGIASVYSGGRTANGEVAAANGLTAAHRTLPFGTMVQVTNRSTGRSVVVRINDRGPFVRGRVIDLTPAGARALGFSGLAPVTLTVVGRS